MLTDSKTEQVCRKLVAKAFPRVFARRNDVDNISVPIDILVNERTPLEHAIVQSKYTHRLTISKSVQSGQNIICNPSQANHLLKVILSKTQHSISGQDIAQEFENVLFGTKGAFNERGEWNA